MLKLRSALTIGLIALPVLVLGYYGYCRYTFDRFNHRYADSVEAYRAGKLPELPGPYLKQGNLSELNFNRVELGNGWIKGVSEQGDCLMEWYGNKPAQIVTDRPDGSFSIVASDVGRITKIFRANGTQQSIPKASDTQITASGALIVVTGSQGNFRITRNDKELITISNSMDRQLERLKYIYLGEYPKLLVTDEGMIAGADDAQIFGNSDSKWKLLNTIPNSKTYLQSSGLGTVLLSPCFDWTKPFYAGSFYFLKENQVQKVDFPAGVRLPDVVATKSSLVFRDEVKTSRLWKWDGDTFSNLPLPPGIITFSIDCANARGDMVLSISRRDPQKAGKDYPYRYSKVLVSDGKYYDFESLLERVGVPNDLIQSYGGKSVFLDERGDIFLVLEKHGQTRVVELRRMEGKV